MAKCKVRVHERESREWHSQHAVCKAAEQRSQRQIEIPEHCVIGLPSFLKLLV